MGTASEAEFLTVHRRLRELAAVHGAEQFHLRAPELLIGLVPAESVVLSLLGPRGEALASTVSGIEMPDWVPTIWPRHAPSHPVARHMRISHDPTPHTISDFWSSRRFHASALYAEIFEPLELEDQLSVYADPGGSGVLGVSFNRRLRTFDDRDHRVAELLTAGLSSAYAAARARGSGSPGNATRLGLPPRQTEVLQQLAQGATYAQTGQRMGITLATVRTHVERLYASLGVQSRGEAVALLFSSAARDPNHDDQQGSEGSPSVGGP